jgi:hypothetical protein
VWSNAGADIALTPGMTSLSDRLMPCSLTACSWASKVLRSGGQSYALHPSMTALAGLFNADASTFQKTFVS